MCWVYLINFLNCLETVSLKALLAFSGSTLTRELEYKIMKTYRECGSHILTP